MIRVAVTIAGILVVSATLAAAAPPPKGAATAATAVLLRMTVPGQDTVSLGELQWPTSTTSDVQSFQYPDDGSIISFGRSRAAVFAQPGDAAAAQSFAEVIVLSLFGGEVVAAQVTASASAGASERSVGADVSASEVQGLRALGRDISTAPGSTASLEDWGSLSVLSVSSGTRKSGPPGAQGSVAGLLVRLTAAHGGLPAGAEILVGSVQATAVAEPSSTPRPDPGTSPRLPLVRPSLPSAPEPDVGGEVPGGPVLVAPEVSARFTGGGYVFPVYGTASFGDSFGGPRPNVPGGWHHGEDIFAPAGTPLLAVAEGTLHTIGFNKLGGYRLWLRDTAGNEFYYAHLSAYSPLAVEGRRVEAGDVIGFVGDTGDAGGTPHLHFEIHPAAMAGLGYDGVVAPYPILLAWRRADDVSFAAGRIYIPLGPGSVTLPPPGAVLLEADDIGPTSGLVPGALERALSR
ncbi:MAG: family metallopeptidase [Thermoleophilia bacterium]|nr:family metallopeptidase [Thermoleophilia bacterium]